MLAWEAQPQRQRSPLAGEAVRLFPGEGCLTGDRFFLELAECVELLLNLRGVPRSRRELGGVSHLECFHLGQHGGHLGNEPISGDLLVFLD